MNSIGPLLAVVALLVAAAQLASGYFVFEGTYTDSSCTTLSSYAAFTLEHCREFPALGYVIYKRNSTGYITRLICMAPDCDPASCSEDWTKLTPSACIPANTGINNRWEKLEFKIPEPGLTGSKSYEYVGTTTCDDFSKLAAVFFQTNLICMASDTVVQAYKSECIIGASYQILYTYNNRECTGNPVAGHYPPQSGVCTNGYIPLCADSAVQVPQQAPPTESPASPPPPSSLPSPIEPPLPISSPEAAPVAAPQAQLHAPVLVPQIGLLPPQTSNNASSNGLSIDTIVRIATGVISAGLAVALVYLGVILYRRYSDARALRAMRESARKNNQISIESDSSDTESI